VKTEGERGYRKLPREAPYENLQTGHEKKKGNEKLGEKEGCRSEKGGDPVTIRGKPEKDQEGC